MTEYEEGSLLQEKINEVGGKATRLRRMCEEFFQDMNSLPQSEADKRTEALSLLREEGFASPDCKLMLKTGLGGLVIESTEENDVAYRFLMRSSIGKENSYYKTSSVQDDSTEFSNRDGRYPTFSASFSGNGYGKIERVEGAPNFAIATVEDEKKYDGLSDKRYEEELAKHRDQLAEMEQTRSRLSDLLSRLPVIGGKRTPPEPPKRIKLSPRSTPGLYESARRELERLDACVNEAILTLEELAKAYDFKTVLPRMERAKKSDA